MKKQVMLTRRNRRVWKNRLGNTTTESNSSNSDQHSDPLPSDDVKITYKKKKRFIFF